MMSSAWTSTNRSPTLTASWSRRLCRAATSFDEPLQLGVRRGRRPPSRRRSDIAPPAPRPLTACSSRAGSTGFSR